MAGPDARRVRRGADRAGRPVEHRAVGRVAAIPAVALDATLEALALRDADDVHELARLEHRHRERLPHLVALELLGLLESDLADHPHRGDVGLLEEAGRGFRHVLLLGAEAELERVIAVRLPGPDPHDRAGSSLDDGHGHVVAVVAEDLGHADLAPDQSLLARHLSPAAPASACISEDDQNGPDPRRRGGPTEAYAAYAAGRADRANEGDGPFSSSSQSLIST